MIHNVLMLNVKDIPVEAKFKVNMMSHNGPGLIADIGIAKVCRCSLLLKRI